MSCKSATGNSVKSNSNYDPNHWGRAPSTDMNVKFAGEEAKDRMYEPKEKKKLVRVLTVIAYIFFVSLAAIMLSLYYVFIWKGSQRDFYKPRTFVVTLPTKCSHADAEPEAEAIVELPRDMESPIIQENLSEKNKSRIISSFDRKAEFSKPAVYFDKFFRMRRDKFRAT
ncbi:uncharacterized protein LOC108739496 isoform X2 [Agrilus planipennis]|uniref:Uncharacterized protein LOC108739496 isoform X2 n=1 Tax=Agrilus planipennis TaxID=224129 RepID=A0A1W4WYG2_AGRPL|nr:uncharacterized protein LOC108739496 isoform X2 [Agrilus planipennis]